MLMPSVLQPLHLWKKKYHCEYNTFLIYLTTSKRGGGGGGVAVLSVKSCWLMLMPSVLQPLHSWKKKYHCEYNTFLIYLTTSKRGGGGGAVLSVKSCWLMLMPSVLQPLHSWKKKYHCEYNTFLIYLTTSKRGGGGGGGVAVLSVKSCWLMLMPSVLQPLHSWKKKYHCEYTVKKNESSNTVLFQFSKKYWLSGVKLTKYLTEKPNSEDPDQTASAEAV